MSKSIDCLVIGHNEMDFLEYERTVRKMGVKSGAYRDLFMNFINYDNRPYSVAEVFNLFASPGKGTEKGPGSLGMGETFSATIAYLCSYLHRRNLTFDYINSFQDEKEELAQKLKDNQILTVAVTTTFYVALFPLLEVVRFVRQHNPGAKIIIGGPFISTQVQISSNEEMDYLFRSMGADFYVDSSQGEAALVEIIGHLKGNCSLDQINNIYYPGAKGYEQTAKVRENNKLEENTVKWDLFSHRLGKYVNVRTAVSCPFTCSFCGFPEHAGKYQVAPVEAIEEELNSLAKNDSVRCVHFIDDTFNVPPRRFKEILRMMIKNRYSFKWHSYFRCQYADEETVELMKESGCEGVYLGLESGNDEILKKMDKRVTTAEYYKGIELLKKQGIVTFSSFIIGFPGETYDSVQDTKKLIETSGLDFYRTQLWYCDPITPIWKEREKYNIQGERFDWSHATMDSNRACDLVEELFLSIKAATWIPQYNFDYDNFWHLVHRDMSLEKVREFLTNFNKGIREKLKESSRQEVSFAVIEKLMAVFKNAKAGAEDSTETNNINDKFNVEFKF